MTKRPSIADDARAAVRGGSRRMLARRLPGKPRASNRCAVLVPLVLFVGLTAMGLATSARSARSEANLGPALRGCPAQTKPDPARSERVLQKLGSVQRGAPLARAAARSLSICFGPSASVALVEPSTAILDDRSSDADNAALLGHLAAHATALAKLPELGPKLRDCDAFVRAAIDAEARAYALEVALRAELGARGSTRPLPFEDALRTATDAERRARIHDYLLDHPDGDGALPGLARAYRSRCISSRPPP